MSKPVTLDTSGLDAAKRFVEYHIGDPSWATHILNAYFYPEETNHELDAEMGKNQ